MTGSTKISTTLNQVCIHGRALAYIHAHIGKTEKAIRFTCDNLIIDAVFPASVGLRHRAVNGYLMSYIRHITYNFLLDGKGYFVVKLHT